MCVCVADNSVDSFGLKVNSESFFDMTYIWLFKKKLVKI